MAQVCHCAEHGRTHVVRVGKTAQRGGVDLGLAPRGVEAARVSVPCSSNPRKAHTGKGASPVGLKNVVDFRCLRSALQLFISELQLPGWLTVDDIEKLELNLVCVVVVIIGVNFVSVIINPGDINLLNYGVGYALPIIGLSLFIFVRSQKQDKNPAAAQDDSPGAAEPGA